MERLQKLSQHLAACSASSERFGNIQVESTSGNDTVNSSSLPGVQGVMGLLEMLENRISEPERQALANAIPGPVRELGDDGAILAVQRAARNGHLHEFWLNWSKRAGNGNPGTNILFPTAVIPKGSLPYIDYMLVISHPDDCARMARLHVRKAETYGIAFLGDGVLATRDVDHWREQREHLIEAFLPEASLGKIFPVSLSRAEYAAEHKLKGLSELGRGVFNINELFLFETMAQLQLALFGESEEHMEKTNVPLRAAFKEALTLGGDPLEAARKRSQARRVVQDYSNTLVARSREQGRVGASEAMEDPGKCIIGPLAARIADFCPMNKEFQQDKIARDNASTLSFAGHDTTANLLTHIIYYICQNPEWQVRMQKEVDEFLVRHPQGPEYRDLSDLVVMKKVILETLRIAPSVPNGTFRETMFDDTIHGVDGEEVHVPRGISFVLPVWSLHYNPNLWGADCNEFNPDREWLPEEIWGSENEFKAYNPSSYRFCPFTFAPRDCIGKAFALLEARTILISFLSRFTFELAEASAGKSLSEISVNVGTLGPKDGLFVRAHPRARK